MIIWCTIEVSWRTASLDSPLLEGKWGLHKYSCFYLFISKRKEGSHKTPWQCLLGILVWAKEDMFTTSLLDAWMASVVSLISLCCVALIFQRKACMDMWPCVWHVCRCLCIFHCTSTFTHMQMEARGQPWVSALRHHSLSSFLKQGSCCPKVQSWARLAASPRNPSVFLFLELG